MSFSGALARWRLASASATLLVALGASCVSARADFPYMPPGGSPSNPAGWKLAPGQTPTNFGDDWKLAATPDPSLKSRMLVNSKADELCGVRGASVVDRNATFPAGTGSCVPAGTAVKTAFEVTLGRPDVLIAVLDSGIKWNDPGAMTALRNKVRLNQGELPAPRHDLRVSLVPGLKCAKFRNPTGGDYNPRGHYDIDGLGVFNVLDYACDSRVGVVLDGPGRLHALRHGPPGVLTPEDLILAFSDGIDHDHNGYVNDIAGWNFVDNNNDPFDDVQYGHGTGEAMDSNGEANTSQELGTCPDCMVMPLRVGESFVADVNRFAQAALYATDSGASVIQEALGTLNSSYFARQAIEYAYNHGTVVIASAADEAAEHHNQPGALPDTIVVNSVNQFNSTFTGVPPSYLQLNGCTNFGTRITLSVPSSSCSSEATGKSAGVAGLIYSAALNAIASGRLRPARDCQRVDGSRCPITPNEVRQLMASGNIAGGATPGSGPSSGTTPADAGNGGQADDVNFAAQPERSCTPAPAAGCTDPNLNTTFASNLFGGIDLPAPHTQRYHARKGFDEFYGYGRLDAYKAVVAAANGTIPPQADITSPDWFQQVDPRRRTFALGGYVNARRAYRCSVQVAPGGEPNNTADFAAARSGWCDGRSWHSHAYRGQLALVSIPALRGRFPANVQVFNGDENGGRPQSSNGRPNTMPYAFTVRVVVAVDATPSAPAMTGEDRRQLFLHRDHDVLPGFPLELRTDGASSPLLVDLDGDNRNELVLATSDGAVYAMRADGSELPGWPVHTARLPLHAGARAYGRVGLAHPCDVLGALAAGDLFHTGRIDVVADDNCGNLYAWDWRGRLVFREHSNLAFSGSPLRQFHTVRQGPRDRVEHGFLASPVLAHLDGNPRGRLYVIAAGDDRHVYAWRADPHRLGGDPVPGFPVLVADPDKLTAVNPVTGALTFSSTRAQPSPGINEDQGKLVDTPAVAAIDGSGRPSIIVGSNEEYGAGTGNEGAINAGVTTAASITALGKTGLLSFANGRLYAIRPSGGRMSCAGGVCHSTAFEPGWPKKIGIIDRGLLPDVGEGIDGSPVAAPLRCPQGGFGTKIGVSPDAGPSYIFNPNGTSCYGRDASGHDNPLGVDFAAGNGQYDHPSFSAVGYPAFGSFDGRSVTFFSPQAGLVRSLDVALNDYQGGQDFIGAWDPGSGNQHVGFPAAVNDLQFLTGPAVGQLTASGGQEVIGGTSSLDLAAFAANGRPASAAWPKLTGDWTIATPTLGSFGTLDFKAGARRDVVSITRSGTLAVYSTPAPACSPSSSPRFHHDDWNSGNYTIDAIPPGRPFGVSVRQRRVLRFRAPGGDLLCGRAARYQLVSSRVPITPESFSSAALVLGVVVPRPAVAGTQQTVRLPPSVRRYVAIRAVDVAGNVGMPAVVVVRSR